MKIKKKVICAMSGGLDSSVAAALLKRAGFDVVGVFMKFWLAPEKNGLAGSWNRCCSLEAEIRARKIAKILKIPFYVFNFEKEFKKRIVDYFLDGYKKGITPNPCVVCNKEIKFGFLLEKALQLDADYIATGHYARIRKFVNSQQTRYSLITAEDKNKDQSYFLWMLNQDQLKRVLFPIGNYTRAKVEGLAKKFKLDFLLEISKSVEICFIPTTINDFLKKYLKQKPGFIVEKIGNKQKDSEILKNPTLPQLSQLPTGRIQEGVSEKADKFRILGEHQGLAFYTLGQRKGIKISGGPYYVLDKDLSKRTLFVTKNEKDLYKKELICKNVNWISGKEPQLPIKVKAKIRYRHQLASATIIKGPKHNSYELKFEEAQKAITPGQSVVFYSPTQISKKSIAGKDQEVLGGGIIS